MKQELLLDGFVGVDEVWVAMCVGTKFKPVVPIFGADLIIHCCSGNHFAASVKITSEVITGVSCTSFQDKFLRFTHWMVNWGFPRPM
jgi:hypothetical protein